MPGHLMHQNPPGLALLCSIEAPKRSPRRLTSCGHSSDFCTSISQRERERESQQRGNAQREDMKDLLD